MHAKLATQRRKEEKKNSVAGKREEEKDTKEGKNRKPAVQQTNFAICLLFFLNIF